MHYKTIFVTTCVAAIFSATAYGAQAGSRGPGPANGLPMVPTDFQSDLPTGPSDLAAEDLFEFFTAEDADEVVSATIQHRLRAGRGLAPRFTGDPSFDILLVNAVSADNLYSIIEGRRATRSELFDTVAELVVADAFVDFGREYGLSLADLETLGPADLRVDAELLERVQAVPLEERLQTVEEMTNGYADADPAAMAQWIAQNMAMFDLMVQQSGAWATAQMESWVNLAIVAGIGAVVAGTAMGLSYMEWRTSDRDSDGDGYVDWRDDYPHDPKKACFPPIWLLVDEMHLLEAMTDRTDAMMMELGAALLYARTGESAFIQL